MLSSFLTVSELQKRCTDNTEIHLESIEQNNIEGMPHFCIAPDGLSTYTSMKILPYYPMEVALSGNSGSAILKCIRSVVEISENVFRIICGSENVCGLRNEFILTII